jgi:hypothetical protein
MPDPITTALVIYGGKELLKRVLGPTLDYVGEGVKEYTKHQAENLKRIFLKADDILEAKGTIAGSVPPKIFKSIWVDGAFCDDELSADYFAGVLAASKSENPKDDRGASILSLIGRLSSYQIRAHYIFYHVIKQLYGSTGANIGDQNQRQRMKPCIPLTEHLASMFNAQAQSPFYDNVTSHILAGLARESLIGQFQYGSFEFTHRLTPSMPKEGIIFEPTHLGAELFLWAYGHSDMGVHEFLKPEKQFKVMDGVTLPSGCLNIQ